MRQSTVAPCARRPACAARRDPLGSASRISQWYRRANTPHGEFVRPRRRGFQIRRVSNAPPRPLGVRETDLCSVAYPDASQHEVDQGRGIQGMLFDLPGSVAATSAALGRPLAANPAQHREGMARVLAVLAGESPTASSLTEGAKELFSAVPGQDAEAERPPACYGPKVCLDRALSSGSTAGWFAPRSVGCAAGEGLLEDLRADWLHAEAFGSVSASLAMDTVMVDARSRAWVVRETGLLSMRSTSVFWPGAILVDDEGMESIGAPTAGSGGRVPGERDVDHGAACEGIMLEGPMDADEGNPARTTDGRNKRTRSATGKTDRGKRRRLSLRWLRRRGRRPEELRKQRQALIRRALSEKQHLTVPAPPGRDPGGASVARHEPVRLSWKPGDPFAGYSGTQPKRFRWHAMFLTAGGVAGLGAGIGYAALWMTGLTAG